MEKNSFTSVTLTPHFREFSDCFHRATLESLNSAKTPSEVGKKATGEPATFESWAHGLQVRSQYGGKAVLILAREEQSGHQAAFFCYRPP